MNGSRILVVDDDRAMAELIADVLRKREHEVVWTTGGKKALEILRSEDFEVVITDLSMHEISGIDLCQQVTQSSPDIAVIIITAFGSVDTAVEAIRAGATDYITKPFEMHDLVRTLERSLEHHALRKEVSRLEGLVRSASAPSEMIGESPAIKRVFDMMRRVADTETGVLICGESGTGKELVARALHRESKRAKGPFVGVNCASLPASLLESELFGHTKGAFTGATSTRAGLLREANGGILLLDEVGEMPLEMQAKLLRALQERRVRPIGANHEMDFDAWIIAATKRDLEAEVEEGRFREDLFYRINVVRIDVPPLRVRGTDILLLAQNFLLRVAKNAGKPVKGISSEAAERLLAYDWPGNVRELENAMRRAVALTRYESIIVDDLPPKIRDFKSTHLSFDSDDLSSFVPLEELEKRYIMSVLKVAGGNKTAAAKTLGVERRTLYRKLERYGIKDDAP